MRKLYLALISSVALLMIGAAGASANTVIHPDCSGSNPNATSPPYNNAKKIHPVNGHVAPPGSPLDQGFEISTPGTTTQLTATQVDASGLACGSKAGWSLFGGYHDLGSLVEEFVVLLPDGMTPTKAYDANGNNVIPVGRGVGYSNVDIASVGLGTANGTVQNQAVKTTVRPRGEGDCPGNEIVCQKNSGFLGSSYGWVTKINFQGKQRYLLTVGPIHPIAGEAGLMKINSMTLCKYFNTASASNCNSPTSDVQQTSGKYTVLQPNYPTCKTNGVWASYGRTFLARVTYRDNSYSNVVKACINWTQ